jgi:hypothetical protein
MLVSVPADGFIGITYRVSWSVMMKVVFPPVFNSQIHSQVMQIASRKFYLRPSFMLRKLLDLRTINDVKVALKRVKTLIWLTLRFDLFNRQAKRP